MHGGGDGGGGDGGGGDGGGGGGDGGSGGGGGMYTCVSILCKHRKVSGSNKTKTSQCAQSARALARKQKICYMDILIETQKEPNCEYSKKNGDIIVVVVDDVVVVDVVIVDVVVVDVVIVDVVIVDVVVVDVVIVDVVVDIFVEGGMLSLKNKNVYQ